MKRLGFTALSGVLCASLLAISPALAMDDAAVMEQLKTMQAQIQNLQGQVTTLQGELKKAKKQADTASQTATTASQKATTASAEATAAQAATNKLTAEVPAGKPMNTTSADTGTGMVLTNKNNIKLTLGGFIEAAGIERNHSESTDIASNFSTGIQFPYQTGYHVSEFRETARQSRLSLLAEGKEDADTTLSAYFEGDFLGAGVSSNSNETNSYNPRIRQGYAAIDDTDLGLHFLGGQAWSLLTMNKQGIQQRQENIPYTIDAQYIPGFTFTRNPQLRLVKDFDDRKLWAGISLESPQALINNSTPNTYTGGTPVTGLPGTGTLNTTAYSLDIAPDVIAKIAYDPGYGHYEVYGIGRFFRDRNNSSNSTIMGGGAGAAALLPIIDKKLDFQISGLGGSGIGRYGAAQLPDATLKSDGGLATIDEVELLAGLTGHPTEKVDAYLYGGLEQERRRAFTNAAGNLGYGYGSPFYINSQCDSISGSTATCIGNTKSVAQLTGGAWWKFYKGTFGMMEVGAQDSLTKRETFTGVGGAPSVTENITMVSFRYYPF